MRRLTYIFILLSVLTSAYAQTDKASKDSYNDRNILIGGHISDCDEVMPYPTVGYKALYDKVMKELRYPKKLKDAGIGGRVLVTFYVEKDGSISEVKVAKKVHPELDKEAVRVVKMMPKWTPGKINGKVERMKYIYPIAFEAAEPPFYLKKIQYKEEKK